MKLNLYIFFLVFSSLLFAQDNSDRTIDSLRIQNKYNTLFNTHSELDIPLNLILDINIPNSHSYFADQNFNLNYLEMNSIKNEMNRSFAIYRAGQKKYYFGVVSDVLGYVSAAATAGFAAYHLYKYRKEYGIK